MASLIREKGKAVSTELIKDINSVLPELPFPASYRDGAELEIHGKVGVWRYRDPMWGDKLLHPLPTGTTAHERPT